MAMAMAFTVMMTANCALSRAAAGLHDAPPNGCHVIARWSGSPCPSPCSIECSRAWHSGPRGISSIHDQASCGQLSSSDLFRQSDAGASPVNVHTVSVNSRVERGGATRCRHVIPLSISAMAARESVALDEKAPRASVFPLVVNRGGGGREAMRMRVSTRTDAKRSGRGDVDALSVKSLEATVELDRLIDELRHTDSENLTQAVAENVLSFNETFWLRLAYRTEACESEEDRNDLGELATVIMNVVERLVQKTEEKMDGSSSILQKILSSAADADGDFVVPMPKESIKRLREAIHESSSLVDESLLAQVGAWIRKLENGPASERWLLPVLQRFYQLFAARALSDKNSKLFPKRQRPDDEGEKLLVSVITADEEEWESLLLNGLVYNPNMVAKRFFDAILRRQDRLLFQLESGSYAQRIISEYLSEIEERAKSLIAAAKEGTKKPPVKQ